MLEQIRNLYKQANELRTDRYIHNDLFSSDWWMIFIVNAVAIIILFYWVDRKKLFPTTIAFLVCFIITGTLDEFGTYFRLWGYSHELIQFSNHFNAADFATVPVMIALIHQTFSTWGKYLIADIAVSLVCAFVGLPLFVYLGITQLNNWSYINSFFTLFLTGVLVKLIVHFITVRNLKVDHPERSEPKNNFNFLQRRRKAR